MHFISLVNQRTLLHETTRWQMRRNLITDFVKVREDQISYGVFAKGAGSDNRFEQNIVIDTGGISVRFVESSAF